MVSWWSDYRIKLPLPWISRNYRHASVTAYSFFRVIKKVLILVFVVTILTGNIILSNTSCYVTIKYPPHDGATAERPQNWWQQEVENTDLELKISFHSSPATVSRQNGIQILIDMICSKIEWLCYVSRRGYYQKILNGFQAILNQKEIILSATIIVFSQMVLFTFTPVWQSNILIEFSSTFC